MPSRCHHSPETPRCRFAFADGRHCSQPAHPHFDGLCFTHGTLAPRASREDNLRCELQPLASGSTSFQARYRALRALHRAVASGRLSPEHAKVLERIAQLIEQTGRFADHSGFQRQSGPTWERLRDLLDHGSNSD